MCSECDTMSEGKNEATPEQIERCKLMGWEYIGDGFFERGEQMGWFDGRSFVKE